MSCAFLSVCVRMRYLDLITNCSLPSGILSPLTSAHLESTNKSGSCENNEQRSEGETENEKHSKQYIFRLFWSPALQSAASSFVCVPVLSFYMHFTALYLTLCL